MNSFRNSSKLVMVILVVMISTFGCKSKKKAMEAAAAEKARMEQEAAFQKQRDEDQRKKDAEEKARRDAEADKASRAGTPYTQLGEYFSAIASSSNLNSANTSINEALTLFASPQTPVLIIISESNGQKDYDRPTTIISYLNYLKDQKKNMNKIEKLQFDNAGKITEVELRKN